MCGLLRSPAFVQFICARMWGCRVLPATLPAPFSATLSLALSVYLHKCRVAGSASARTACPVCPTLRQSQSRHGSMSSLHPSPPRLPVSAPPTVWMNVYFLFPWCQTSLPFDFLSVLVVQGGAVCLPTPPSWFSCPKISYNQKNNAVILTEHSHMKLPKLTKTLFAFLALIQFYRLCNILNGELL